MIAPAETAGPSPVTNPYRRFPPLGWMGVTTWKGAIGALCVAAIWIFASSYGGIEGDARIYMARALADLDPAGVGRDMMFVQDGQSAFSVFGPFAAALVRHLGPAHAGLALAFLDIAVWSAAMTAFASRFVSGRALGAVLVCAAVMRCPYGFYPLMASREIIAVPRPLAEAGVLFALAALIEGRAVAAFALLGFAALIHPIMALPGIGIGFIMLAMRDRRWLAFGAVGMIGTVAAGLAGLPLFARLTTVIDPEWRALLADRNPYLFVSSWPTVSLAPVITQAVTLTIFAMLQEGRRRAVLAAILAMSVVGVGVSFLLGDTLSLLLVVQAQPWRVLWLVAVVAMPAFGVCAIELPKRGPYGQITLAFLVFAWLTFDLMPASPIAALMALGLFAARSVRAPVFSRFFVRAACFIVLAAVIPFKWQDAGFAWDYVNDLPPASRDYAGPFWRVGLLAIPFIAAALAFVRWPGRRYETAAQSAGLVLLIGLIAACWDYRTETKKRIETGFHDPALVAAMASKPGEVYWTSGDDGWYWLGRPQWNSFTQGAGIVFSRPLAMQWLERTKALVALGLVDPGQMRPWRLPAKIVVPTLTPEAIKGLCTRPDAPAWIVSPLPASMTLPPGFGGQVWHAPGPQALGGVAGHGIKWYIYDSYGIVPCAGNDAMKPS